MAAGKVLDLAALRAMKGKRRTVDVPLSTGSVARLRALSAGQVLELRAEIARLQKEGGDTDDILPGLIADCLVGSDGELMIPADERCTLSLEAFEFEDMKEIAGAALKLNGLHRESHEEVKEAEKN